MGSSRPSFPMPSEPNLRRLGLGGGGGGGDRPIRAQLVIAVVVLGLLIAVPLYLLRGPGDEADEDEEAGPAASGREPGKIIRTRVDAGAPEKRIRLGPLQRVKCSAARRSRGNEGGLCDSLRPVEVDFRKGILANVDCAPRTGKEGTINFVLEVDFSAKKLNVFPGASGRWKGKQAKRAAKCVLQSLPPVDWDNLQHRYRYYMLAILATYPAPSALEGLPEFK